MLDESTIENISNISEKKEMDSNNNSASSIDTTSIDTTKTVDVTREQELKRKLAATRNMKMMMAHDDLDQIHDDAIDTYTTMPHALNTEMFDSEILGDLDDL